MTKSSIALFISLTVSILLVGCSDAPPTEEANVTAPTLETPAQTETMPNAPAPFQASRWTEGTHYTVVASEASEKTEVVEYFSYWCPHCYQFERVANLIKSNLVEGVGFRKVHVNFMGFASQETQEAATKAMLIGRALNQEQNVNTAIFTHIHDRQLSIENLADLKSLLMSQGISESDFEATLQTQDFSQAFAKNNRDIEQFRASLTGVPSIIINGKYKTQFTNDMTLSDVPDLINWLSQQK